MTACSTVGHAVGRCCKIDTKGWVREPPIPQYDAMLLPSPSSTATCVASRTPAAVVTAAAAAARPYTTASSVTAETTVCTFLLEVFFFLIPRECARALVRLSARVHACVRGSVSLCTAEQQLFHCGIHTWIIRLCGMYYSKINFTPSSLKPIPVAGVVSKIGILPNCLELLRTHLPMHSTLALHQACQLLPTSPEIRCTVKG